MDTDLIENFLTSHSSRSSCSVCASPVLSDYLLHVSQLDRTGLATFDAYRSDASVVLLSAALSDADGRRRLRTLEAIGDSALSTVIALVVDVMAWPVSIYQQARSVCTNDKVLAQLFWSSPMATSVSFVADVYSVKGTAGAKSFEAMLGVVAKYGGLPAVLCMAYATGILDLYDWPAGTTSQSILRQVEHVGALSALNITLEEVHQVK